MLSPDSVCQDAAWGVIPGGAEVLGITLSTDQINLLARYCSLLLSANRTVNLTAVREPEDMMRVLILDSLAAVPVLNGMDGVRSVVDVGTGGGIPGVPLAVACPGVALSLVDSVGKKARFVADTVQELELPNVDVVTARAETYGRNEGREAFDACVSRAVAPTAVLVEYCAPLVREGGWLVLYKSGDPEAEVEAAERAGVSLGCEPNGVYTTPPGLGVSEDKFLVVMRKTRPTPERFPRRLGLARSRPL